MDFIISCLNTLSFKSQNRTLQWTASSEFGTYRLCEQRRFRRACASAQSRQNLRCCSYKQWIKENLQTESQIPGPTEWLGMRSWNLSWRNVRRHKFAWRGPQWKTHMQHCLTDILVIEVSMACRKLMCLKYVWICLESGRLKAENKVSCMCMCIYSVHVSPGKLECDLITCTFLHCVCSPSLMCKISLLFCSWKLKG